VTKCLRIGVTRTELCVSSEPQEQKLGRSGEGSKPSDVSDLQLGTVVLSCSVAGGEDGFPNIGEAKGHRPRE